MKIVQVHPGLLPIPPNGWGAVEKIIWEYKLSFEKQGHTCDILYLNDIDVSKYDVVHIHVANLALLAHQRNIPYYFTCHDHHAYLYGKDSQCFKENYEAIKYSIKSFVPAKYLVNYFDLPNLEYLSHGVNNDVFFPIKNEIIDWEDHKLLCVANNGFIHNQSEDRKGFGYAIQAAKELNLPITIAGPINNKNFFDKNNFEYDKLKIIYDLTEEELIKTYQSHTIFLHPSILEAGHPNLTLLEAMSCGLPIIGTFEENNDLLGLYKCERDVNSIIIAIKNVKFNHGFYKSQALKTSLEKSWDKITENLIEKYEVMKDQLINIYNSTIIDPKNFVEPQDEVNDLHIDFNDHSKIEIKGNLKRKYHVKFIDKKSNNLIYEDTINNNMWAAANLKYFVDWKIDITELSTNANLVYDLDLKNKRVKIVNESPSLGDYISWMPAVDDFQKKHDCILDFYTPNKSLFEEEYKNINFHNYNYNIPIQYKATYRIGCFDVNDRSKSPKDYRTQNLQQVAYDILGLEYKDKSPNVTVRDKTRKLNEKYVCISTASTAGCKHWQNKGGWQQVVDYLNSLGYKVVVLQKESLTYMDLQGLNNVIHPETKTLDEVISWLYNCEFYLGLSSGISWLAWSLKKNVVLISGFTKSFTEFNTPYRVINENVCNGCWNDTNFNFDAGDWKWCPKLKNTSQWFECSKYITFEMVKSKIDKILESF